MKNLLLPTLLVLFSAALFGQNPQGGQPGRNGGGRAMNIGRLYGKIVEKSSKEPVAYASVTVFKKIGGRDSLIGGALSLEATRHLPRWRFGALLGDASYAIYLLHGFVSATFDWFWSRSNWVADISFCLLGSIAVGIGAHLLVEKPVTRFLRTLWTEKAAAPA